MAGVHARAWCLLAHGHKVTKVRTIITKNHAIPEFPHVSTDKDGALPRHHMWDFMQAPDVVLPIKTRVDRIPKPLQQGQRKIM
jgi:hypothetical protein